MPRLLISDSQWEILQNVMKESGAYMKDKLRLTIEGILWRIRTGSPWRDLPAEFGSYSSIFNKFNRWSKNGIWTKIFEELIDEPDNELNSVDGTVIRVHQHASSGGTGGDTAIGKSKGGWTTKVIMKCDAHGNPLKSMIFEGQANEISGAKTLISDFR